MKRKRLSEINAGSMADIAFLLLIFFLVTTTMVDDKGIFRKIPEKNADASPIELHDRNVFDININKNNEILVGNNIIQLNDLHNLVSSAMLVAKIQEGR